MLMHHLDLFGNADSTVLPLIIQAFLIFITPILLQPIYGTLRDLLQYNQVWKTF